MSSSSAAPSNSPAGAYPVGGGDGREINRAFLMGERVYLRPFEETDITEEYMGWVRDREVVKHLESGRFPETMESAHRYLEEFKNSDTNLFLAIVDRETGDHIGNVRLHHIDWIHGTARTGIMIGRKDYWGKGYAFAVYSLLIEHAFNRLGLRKINSAATASNLAAIAFLKKLGYKQEGLARQQFLVEGEYEDRVLFGLLRHEFYKFANKSD